MIEHGEPVTNLGSFVYQIRGLSWTFRESNQTSTATRAT
jgi:hypothetical protein